MGIVASAGGTAILRITTVAVGWGVGGRGALAATRPATSVCAGAHCELCAGAAGTACSAGGRGARGGRASTVPTGMPNCPIPGGVTSGGVAGLLGGAGGRAAGGDWPTGGADRAANADWPSAGVAAGACPPAGVVKPPGPPAWPYPVTGPIPVAAGSGPSPWAGMDGRSAASGSGWACRGRRDPAARTAVKTSGAGARSVWSSGPASWMVEVGEPDSGAASQRSGAAGGSNQPRPPAFTESTSRSADSGWRAAGTRGSGSGSATGPRTRRGSGTVARPGWSSGSGSPGQSSASASSEVPGRSQGIDQSDDSDVATDPATGPGALGRGSTVSADVTGQVGTGPRVAGRSASAASALGRSALEARSAAVGSLLAGSPMPGSVLAGWPMRGSVLRGSVLRGSVLRGSVLRGSVLRGSLLGGSVLPGSAPAGSWPDPPSQGAPAGGMSRNGAGDDRSPRSRWSDSSAVTRCGSAGTDADARDVADHGVPAGPRSAGTAVASRCVGRTV